MKITEGTLEFYEFENMIVAVYVPTTKDANHVWYEFTNFDLIRIDSEELIHSLENELL
jgi:hypothetical protein